MLFMYESVKSQQPTLSKLWLFHFASIYLSTAFLEKQRVIINKAFIFWGAAMLCWRDRAGISGTTSSTSKTYGEGKEQHLKYKEHVCGQSSLLYPSRFEAQRACGFKQQLSLINDIHLQLFPNSNLGLMATWILILLSSLANQVWVLGWKTVDLH